jgi:ketol-acid reductoisomerase
MISTKLFTERDGDLSIIQSKNVCIIGYGSQGQAHALNLRDSGVQNICIGLPIDSKSRLKAQNDNFNVVEVYEGVKKSDIIMLLAPDSIQPKIYQESIQSYIKPNTTLLFAHGFNIHFNFIHPKNNINVGLIAPKGPGHLVRKEYLRGFGVPVLIANSSENCLNVILSYAKALGGLKVGGILTTFKEECETDLFGEQAVLCGGLAKLIEYGFETLIENGYQPEIAYFECLYELKLITDLIYEGGLNKMRESISDTAEFGDYYSGKKVISEQVKNNMKLILNDIQNGKFAHDFINDQNNGHKLLSQLRMNSKSHPIEKIGLKLRQNMFKK